MKHGQERASLSEGPPVAVVVGANSPGLRPLSESDALRLGLSMPIGLYRYLYPCRCTGGDCKCEAGS